MSDELISRARRALEADDLERNRYGKEAAYARGTGYALVAELADALEAVAELADALEAAAVAVTISSPASMDIVGAAALRAAANLIEYHAARDDTRLTEHEVAAAGGPGLLREYADRIEGQR